MLSVTELLKAIQYKSIDEARQAIRAVAKKPPFENPFDDDGEEPEGLLTVVPQDRLSESLFYALFELDKGVLVEVEKIHYSGFGPPAEEDDYMGFVSEHCAYVLKGRRLPIEISDCSFGATDIHHLDALVLERTHPINREDLASRLNLGKDWNFDRLFELIAAGAYTADEIDGEIHKGVQ